MMTLRFYSVNMADIHFTQISILYLADESELFRTEMNRRELFAGGFCPASFQ